MQTVDSAELAQAKFSFNQESCVFELCVLLREITLLLSQWRGIRKKGNADLAFSLRKKAVFLIFPERQDNRLLKFQS